MQSAQRLVNNQESDIQRLNRLVNQMKAKKGLNSFDRTWIQASPERNILFQILKKR